MKLHAVKFGIAFGALYAAMFFLYGAVAALFGWGIESAELIGSFYYGFGPTLGGAIIGAAWGMAIGFVFFAVAAWIYNALVGQSAQN